MRRRHRGALALLVPLGVVACPAVEAPPAPAPGGAEATTSPRRRPPLEPSALSKKADLGSPDLGSPDLGSPQSDRVRPPPPGFVDLATLPGMLLDVRYATPDNFTGAPLRGYEAAGAWLRREPARALAAAAAELAEEGLQFCIFDAYRPAQASAAMVDWASAAGKVDLLDDGYIARRSRHNAGVAVDLTLCGPDGTAVDMGGAFDAFEAGSHFGHATGTAKANRQALRRVMQAHRFVPYAKEWWHFTWKGSDAEVAIDVPYSTMSTWNHHQSTP